MEFDKSKILTVVTADQAKVGSMGYFSNYIPTLEGYVTGHIKPDKLIRVSLNTIYPFLDGHNYYSLFYPAPEPTYAERQAQWVKENNVKKDTKVRVTRTFTSCEDGCNVTFTSPKGTFIGDDCTVVAIDDASIAVRSKQKNDWWCFPYFVLEVVKEPTYRSFKNAEEFKPYRDEWFRAKHDGGILRICAYNDKGVQEANGKVNTYQIFFEEAERENGEPCGVKEEA